MFPERQSPPRQWREIAAEAAREQDPEKLVQLTEELARALEREKKLRSQAIEKFRQKAA